MLRHPAQILTSAEKSYGTWQTDASRAAAWINVMLETERATRGAPRAYVAYADLLADWRAELRRVGAALDMPRSPSIDARRTAEVDAFVDPSLHRNRTGWEGLDVPASVRDLAERGLGALQAGRPGRRRRRRARRAPAPRTTRSTARPRRSRSRRSSPCGRARTAAAEPPPTLRVRIARRVPAPCRERLRRARR